MAFWKNMPKSSKYNLRSIKHMGLPQIGAICGRPCFFLLTSFANTLVRHWKALPVLVDFVRVFL